MSSILCESHAILEHFIDSGSLSALPTTAMTILDIFKAQSLTSSEFHVYARDSPTTLGCLGMGALPNACVTQSYMPMLYAHDKG